MMDDAANARGDASEAPPPGGELIEVRLADLQQLFNSIDPSPFRERDLDPKVEEYIVDCYGELRADRPLCLVVHLGRQVATDDDVAALRAAVREHFTQRARSERRLLRRLLRTGRISLVIGLLFLAVAMVLGDLASGLVGRYDYGEILAHSLLIGGWVALWRPIEIFLYDWWPIRAEARLFDRLSAMAVRVENPPAAA
ncbi:MAG: hypothetical protein ACRERC_04495 [Candidatus Binatia bacterium]